MHVPPAAIPLGAGYFHLGSNAGGEDKHGGHNNLAPGSGRGARRRIAVLDAGLEKLIHRLLGGWHLEPSDVGCVASGDPGAVARFHARLLDLDGCDVYDACGSSHVRAVLGRPRGFKIVARCCCSIGMYRSEGDRTCVLLISSWFRIFLSGAWKCSHES